MARRLLEHKAMCIVNVENAIDRRCTAGNAGQSAQQARRMPTRHESTARDADDHSIVLKNVGMFSDGVTAAAMVRSFAWGAGELEFVVAGGDVASRRGSGWNPVAPAQVEWSSPGAR